MTDERPFTVKDRRTFTSDGLLREDVAEPSAPAPSLDSPLASAEALDPEVTLEALFADLAAAAAFHLGLIQDEGTEGGPRVDLPAARHAIAMLELLQVKTSGHRTPREDQALERLLFDLRMAWMARAGGGTA